jgi:hypothetical protein
MLRLGGQILRFLGLLVELLGFLALAFRTRTDAAGAPLPGNFPPRLVWGVIICGFVMWLIGTIINFWVRSAASNEPVRDSKYDLNL